MSDEASLKLKKKKKCMNTAALCTISGKLQSHYKRDLRDIKKTLSKAMVPLPLPLKIIEVKMI